MPIWPIFYVLRLKQFETKRAVVLSALHFFCFSYLALVTCNQAAKKWSAGRALPEIERRLTRESGCKSPNLIAAELAKKGA